MLRFQINPVGSLCWVQTDYKLMESHFTHLTVSCQVIKFAIFVTSNPHKPLDSDYNPNGDTSQTGEKVTEQLTQLKIECFSATVERLTR